MTLEPKIALRLKFLTRVVLVNALQSGHAFVPTLIAVANKMIAEIELRGWA